MGAEEHQPTKNAAAPGEAADSSGLHGLTEAIEIGPADPANDPLLGKDFGGVTLVRLIAEGGMGRVYEGLQDRPRRAVAVKVMRPGFVSPEACRRFDNEAEVLGRLRHPCIAQIFSAGICSIVGAKVPYFVMEYIPDALPITKYADRRKLPTDDRLALFRKVCDAVAHGHEKGVIHRDLKPSNILVEPSGDPKIIDFGVARCVDASPEAMTALTDMGQLIGTLQYMSPEQFAANPAEIDVRSDVYALGVILYELLTGRPPYEIRQKQIFEAARVVREQKPVSPAKLNSTVRPDVARIAGRCLHKERTRRYANAAELATAIGSYLSGQPVAAPRRGLFAESLGRNAGASWFEDAAIGPGWPSTRRLGFLAALLCLGGVVLWGAKLLVQERRDPLPAAGVSPDARPPLAEQSSTPAPATDFKYEAKGNAVTINGYLGADPVVWIPDMIEGRPVTAIGREAFRDRADLTTVRLPKNLVALESNAFFNCTRLSGLTLPDGLLHIRDGALVGTELKTLSIPASVIGIEDCLYVARKLREIKVDPDNQHFVAVDGVLYDKRLTTLLRCPSLKTGELVVPPTVEVIARHAFAGCDALERVVVPEGLKRIDGDAFSGCRFRERLDTPAADGGEHHVTYTIRPEGIEVNGYRGKGGAVRIPGRIAGRPVVAIASDAFNGQASIRSVVLPPGVEGIGNAAFAGCSSMESITMPESLVGIGFNAFQFCNRLKSIAMPARVSQIGAVCFFGSSGLEAINVDKDNKKFASVDGVLYDKAVTRLIVCPAGKEGRLSIPPTVTTIEGFSFAGCSLLTHIVIPDSVTNLDALDARTFQGCDAVRETVKVSPPDRP